MNAAIDRYSPLGFYNLACDFQRAAAHLSNSVENKSLKLRFHQPVYHLHAHSIELLLKSYLRARGISANKIRNKFGHDFEKLWDGCCVRKLKCKKPKRTEQPVKFVGKLVMAQRFRYFETGYLTLPRLDEVSEVNERIRLAVSSVGNLRHKRLASE